VEGSQQQGVFSDNVPVFQLVGGRQDCEGKRPGGRAVGGAKAGKEGGKLAIGQRPGAPKWPRASFSGRGNTLARWPRQRAGFSPSRQPRAFA
jgi:hypothetical protein